MSEDSGEKTEEPTGHKLSQAREKGQVPKSMEISASIVLLVSCGALFLLGPMGWDRLVAQYHYFLNRVPDFSGTPGDMIALGVFAIKEIIIITIPLAIIILLTGILINVYQIGGFMVVSDSLVPKLDKLNFIKGWPLFHDQDRG
jgi:flagellar biosynthesis protein FlhB